MRYAEFMKRLLDLMMLPGMEDDPEILIHIKGLGWYSPTGLEAEEGDLNLEIDYDPRVFEAEQKVKVS